MALNVSWLGSPNLIRQNFQIEARVVFANTSPRAGIEFALEDHLLYLARGIGEVESISEALQGEALKMTMAWVGLICFRLNSFCCRLS